MKLTNQYQLGKLKEFFQKLQAGLYVTPFSDDTFQSLEGIPQVKFEKCPKQKFLIAKVRIAEELFYYAHPFLFPDFLNRKLTKYELEVQFQVIQVFSSVEIEKTFLMKEFFENYSSSLTN